MLRYNPHTRLLEQEDYHYELQDPPEPNLIRDSFSYGEVPKVAFNRRVVPMQPPDEIWLTDTTFRDGQQARPPYTVDQVVDLFQLLHRLGGPKGMIRQSEFFLYQDRDREAVEKCQELGHAHPEITGWIRAAKRDFQLVKEMGLRETGILTSVSDYHIFLKLRRTRRQAIDQYLDIVRSALDVGIVPRCHFEDITRADFYGCVVPFAQELMRLSEQAGLPVKIRCCDTLGLAVNYPGASLPRCVGGIIYGLTQYAGVPPAWLEWHGHNDFYKVVSNAATAWLYGCAAVSTTLLGLGERTGNCPTEAMVMEYVSLRGDATGMDTTAITDIARYFEQQIGYAIPASQPFVGSDFNVTRAGIHIDGLSKNEEIYNIFDTAKILNRPVGVTISDKSGAAGIAYWINSRYGLAGDKRIDKRHPAVCRIKERVDEEYGRGRVAAISSAEMEALVREFVPQLFED